MKKTYLATSLAVILLANNAYAEGTGNTYVGLSFGKMEADVDVISFDDTTFKLFGGVKLNDKFAIEGHFANMDTTELGVNLDVTSLGVSGVFTPMQDAQFAPFFKVGLNMVDAEASMGGLSASDDEMELSFGLGAAFAVNERFSIRGEYEKFETDLDMMSVGASYSF